jgi:hypothetical protein
VTGKNYATTRVAGSIGFTVPAFADHDVVVIG